MENWRIRPIVRGEVLAEKSELLAYQQPGMKVWVPSIVWYVTNGKQHVVVDTGFDGPLVGESEQSGYKIRATAGLSQVLEEAGCPIQRVSVVILTHLHWDHCGNLGLFKKAELLVQREEARYAVAPLSFEADAFNAPSSSRQPSWLRGRLTFIDGDANVFRGLSIMSTPGHTPGHQSVIVEVAGHNYGIAGDLLPTFENIHFPNTDDYYPPACFDYWQWWVSVKKLERRCDYILPSHDPSMEDKWIS